MVLFNVVSKKKQVPIIATPALTDKIDFKTQIQPILQKRCAPCHFPGGKMYEKMPFDTANTILTHKEGILRRIKDNPDNALIREFIEQNNVKWILSNEEYQMPDDSLKFATTD